jgi:hypothetical protein
VTQLSYLFIRVNQTQKPQTGALLKAVAQILFSREVQEGLFPSYGFTALPAAKIQAALKSLDTIQLSPDAKPWITETSTVNFIGQGPNVISGNRKSWSMEQLLSVSDQVNSMSAVLTESLGRAVHGSGTTNPSSLIWEVMETLEKRAPITVHLTYRAVSASSPPSLLPIPLPLSLRKANVEHGC